MQWNAKIRTSEIGKTPKSECFSRSVFDVRLQDLCPKIELVLLAPRPFYIKKIYKKWSRLAEKHSDFKHSVYFLGLKWDN